MSESNEQSHKVITRRGKLEQLADELKKLSEAIANEEASQLPAVRANRVRNTWLVGVTINGKSFSIRQPLAHDSMRRVLAGLVIVAAATRIG